MTKQASTSRSGVCTGLTVVEVALGISELGLGLAAGMPGMVLADLGARVVRLVDAEPCPVDRDVAWGRAWHRDKELVPIQTLDQVEPWLAQADVALVYGSEAQIERQGLGYEAVSPRRPALVYARCRPSCSGSGSVPDYGLLVEARAGFCSQLVGHRSGPIFVDVRAGGAGAAFLMMTSVFALLRRRELTGQGGWAESSLYDGMLATLGTMIGRSECAPEHVEGYWEQGSTFPNFMYPCADGELIQVWFGGKGMYDKLIKVLGDTPSTSGYYSDQVSGELNARAVRWRDMFAQFPRAVWVERLREVGVACEPVLDPGEALADPHLAEVGLAFERRTGQQRDLVVGRVIDVTPVSPGAAGTAVAEQPTPAPQCAPGGGLLAGVRVLDFSAFVAGPLTAQVLGDLGADVIKVEPPQGEAMRAAAYALAACQRGKRSLALDITAPDAREVVEHLIRWADVVVHNFRVGVSNRLGIDEDAVARIKPTAVYCHASAFGGYGPRAKMPGNDALMQALTGFERAVGGAGNEPLAATWIPIDMAGGWVAAVGVLAGLYAQARSGQGQQVSTSLLGAGMLLQSGVFLRDGEVVCQPELDAAQTGYGPGYRLYRCEDEQWLALVVPSPSAWERLAQLPGCAGLPLQYLPLRRGRADESALAAERVLEQAFAAAPLAVWSERLLGTGILCEPVAVLNRDQFRRRILDDPLNQELGRVLSYRAFDWGKLDQIGVLVRCGPNASSSRVGSLPEIGEHSQGILQELGISAERIAELLSAKVVRQFQES